MLGWAVTFFLLALVAAFLGFGTVAGVAASVARILFFLFLAGIVVIGVMRAFSGRTP